MQDFVDQTIKRDFQFLAQFRCQIGNLVEQTSQFFLFDLVGAIPQLLNGWDRMPEVPFLLTSLDLVLDDGFRFGQFLFTQAQVALALGF